MLNLRGGRAVAVLFSVGAVSAIATALTIIDFGDKIGSPHRREYAALGVLAFAGSVFAGAYRQWKRIEELEASLKPKLKIVFEETGQRPYFQTRLLKCSEDVTDEERRYRIGIKNLSKAEIPHVRAILERCEPVGSEGARRISKDHVYPGQRLQIMGLPETTDEVLLGVSGEEPSVFVEVCYDFLSDEGATKMICFAYVGDRERPSPSGPYHVTIRVEGGNTFDLASFVVERVGKEKLLTMRPAQ